MTSNEETDVVVVGGGPGGSTLATLVAMAGHHVVLLEKEKFPRYQIGESLLPSTVHGICRLTGVADELAKAGFTKKRGGTFRWGANPEPWTFAFSISPKMTGETSYAYQVERSKFDQILLDHARHTGVDVREQHTVTGVIDDERPGPRRDLHRRRRQRRHHPREVRGRRLWQQKPHLPARRSDKEILGVLPQPGPLRLLRRRQAPARTKLRQHLVLRLRQRLVLVHPADPRR